MTLSYQTLTGPSTGLYKEKGSKFLAFAYPIANESQVAEVVARLKKEYHDARHHCFAWILGPEKNRFRAFDDGEPGHSAGTPILNQLRSFDVTDAIVVVVRYFGGVKLGVGGLTAAYKAAAHDALNHATLVRIERTTTFEVTFSYDDTSVVMKTVEQFGLKILDQRFDTRCYMAVEAPLAISQRFADHMETICAINPTIVVKHTD